MTIKEAKFSSNVKNDLCLTMQDKNDVTGAWIATSAMRLSGIVFALSLAACAGNVHKTQNGFESDNPVGANSRSLQTDVVPTQPEAPDRPMTLQEMLAEGHADELAGNREAARDAYEAAAETYPNSALPLVKLAQGFFDQGDYGNAISASKEVLQREPANQVALGILTVSGLRVSTAAVSSLREIDKSNAGTPTEAVVLAKKLRELLGENVLVPRPVVVVETPPPPPPPPPQRKPLKPKVHRYYQPHTVPASAAPAPAAQGSSSGSADPFSALK